MNSAKENVLVTGAAGFIGFHVARRLLKLSCNVIGVDGLTPYYDVSLKRERIGILEKRAGFQFHEFMLEDQQRLLALMQATRPVTVVHLAAQAGVRYSIENPRAYINSNIFGTFNVLEACRAAPPAHILIASTSSVYGDSNKVPFREDAETSQPLSLYAATKKSAEVIAYSYSHLYGLPTTAFRFFTVYGPWGRPDMALFLFTAAILENREIEIYGDGQMLRDFTYIDDLVDGILGLIDQPPPLLGAAANAPFRVVNIGSARAVGLEQFIEAIEKVVGRKARRKYLPMQLGDVRETWADTELLRWLVASHPPHL